LKKAGCWTIRFGVEAGSEYIRNEIYEKGITEKDIKKAFSLCKKHSLQTVGFFMLGGPGETETTLHKTYQMIKEIKPDYTAVYFYYPLPETKSVEKLMQLGCKIIKNEIGDGKTYHEGYFIKNPNLNQRRINSIKNKIYFQVIPKTTYREICKRKLKFFWQFPPYFLKGRKYGMSLRQIFMYYFYWWGIKENSKNPER
jgi:radical SAM superfamily enzyme YgiQ (UPF0313 family)